MQYVSYVVRASSVSRVHLAHEDVIMHLVRAMCVISKLLYASADASNVMCVLCHVSNECDVCTADP